VDDRLGRILVVTGPPGAGKTTVSRLVAGSYERGVHLEADAFWSFIASGYIVPWQPAAHEQNTVVADATHAAVVQFALGGYTVVLDGVVFPWSLERLVDRAWHEDVDVDYVILRPDRDACLRRGTTRIGHGLVDPEPIGQLYDQFTNIGWYEHHVLDTTADTPEETARRIVEGEHRPLIEIIGPPETEKLVLADSDTTWPARFEEQRARIIAALADVAVRVDHVGSTAVPDLPAKPIIDIQVSVPNADDESAYAPHLERAGYAMRVREPGHRMFRTPERDAHVHVCSAGGGWERRHLVFRDWLRTHPDDRDLYAEVKRRLLREAWPSMDAYAAAKSAVIATITRHAES